MALPCFPSKLLMKDLVVNSIKYLEDVYILNLAETSLSISNFIAFLPLFGGKYNITAITNG